MKAFGDQCNPHLTRAPTPVGAICNHCDETIKEGDSGIWLNNDTLPLHLECFMRSVVGSAGHLMGRCSCFGGDEDDPPGLTRREAAKAAMEMFYSKQAIEAITCPQCGRTSYNQNDVWHRYCAACHQYHDEMGPK